MKIPKLLVIPPLKVISRQKRKVYEYETIPSISRMREDGHELCKTLSINQLLKSSNVRDLICDHASRRVQLFYYTAVVYYKEKCLLGRDTTISQIGRSGCTRCSAAHSAIIPRLWDNSNSVLSHQFRKNPRNQRLKSKLQAMGFKKQELEASNSRMKIHKLFEEFKINHSDRLIRSNSAMQYALDSTVIVPREVNEYDCVLENHVRPIALGFLQSVSFGILAPYEATELFVGALNDFFGQSARATAQTKILIKELGKTSVLNGRYQQIRNEIKEVKFGRSILKRDNPIELLDADLVIIKLQREASILPEKEHLELGSTLFQQKLKLLKI